MEARLRTARRSNKGLLLTCVLLLFVVALSGCRGFRRNLEATPVPGASNSSGGAGAAAGSGWKLTPVNITTTAAGNLHVELAATNLTGQWSALTAGEKPATFVTNGGSRTACESVKVGSGGHYIPPGFQFRGYTLRDGKTQLLSVECKGADPYGAKLLVPYSYVTGEYDYYAQEKGKVEGELEADLGTVQATLTYPAADASAVKAQPLSEAIPALNDCTVTNTAATRTADAITLKWKVANPGEYDTKVHLGEPPVLGSDGIIYGARVSPDIVDQPFSPGKGDVEFETTVAAPQDVTGLYLLLSVEQNRERLFANYLIDLTGLK